MAAAAVIAFTRSGMELGVEVAACLKNQGMRCDRFVTEGVMRQLQEAAGAQETSGGRKTAIFDRYLKCIDGGLSDWTGKAFADYDLLVFVGALGIAVRAIAPWVEDKFKDPAVVVLDEAGSFVIPVLSGHVGGGNHFAGLLAAHLGAQAVITTATDVRDKFAVDLFAVRNGLKISSRNKAKLISADLLQGKKKSIYTASKLCKIPVALPQCYEDQLSLCRTPENADIVVDYRIQEAGTALQLIPEGCLWLGIGCKKGMPYEKIREAVDAFLEEHGYCREAVAGLASVNLKAAEAGLLQLARTEKWAFVTYTPEELDAVPGEFTASAFVKARVGVDNVCERAALLAAMARGSMGGTLINRKESKVGITLAAALMNRRIDFE